MSASEDPGLRHPASLRPTLGLSVLLVAIALLACGPPEITDYAKERHASQCNGGNEVEEQRVMSGVRRSARGWIVGVCARSKKGVFEYSVSTVTSVRQKKQRGKVCDALRRVVPSGRIVVYDRGGQYSTRCGRGR